MEMCQDRKQTSDKYKHRFGMQSTYQEVKTSYQLIIEELPETDSWSPQTSKSQYGFLFSGIQTNTKASKLQGKLCVISGIQYSEVVVLTRKQGWKITSVHLNLLHKIICSEERTYHQAEATRQFRSLCPHCSLNTMFTFKPLDKAVESVE